MKMNTQKPIIQIALDFVDIERAVEAAQESVPYGVDWIEAGTMLIKSEGLNAVRKLKELFPKNTIVADLKIVDTGRFELEYAAKAGADVVTVLGVSDDSTIREVVEAGKKWSCKVMADMINVPDIKKRSLELEALGVDYICVHVSIDQQMQGIDPITELKKISKECSIPLAIAGGINPENVWLAVNAGASIVIVGGAITKAPDRKKAVENIQKAITARKPVKTELYKKYTDPKEVFKIVSTANISDAMHRAPVMKDIKTQNPGTKIIGKAVTVTTYPGDWAKPVEAIDYASEGDVIVINALGMGPAVWGELASESCKKRKIAGVVIDGAVRDIKEIRKMNFGIFSKEICSNAGEPKGEGEINTQIKCGGININPGDWIIGDDDGVVVVPQEKAIEIANRALDVFEKENRIREEIRKGSTLSKVLRIEKWEKK